MQRVRIKKKRQGVQRNMKADYESPYAEYLLGAIKEGDGSHKKGAES